MDGPGHARGAGQHDNSLRHGAFEEKSDETLSVVPYQAKKSQKINKTTCDAVNTRAFSLFIALQPALRLALEVPKKPGNCVALLFRLPRHSNE